MRRLFFFFVCLLILPHQAFSYENLDELEARTGRKSTNTFYSGEDSGNNYIWQPQLAVYKDISTSHEVWVWTQTDNTSALTSATEYGWQPWSADGKRMAWTWMNQSYPGCYSCTSGYPWFISQSDGSKVRPVCNDSAKTASRQVYFDWSPTLPDIAYHIGNNRNGNSGLDRNGLYKITYTDIGESYSGVWADMIPGDTTSERAGINKGAITGDGKYYVGSVFAETEPFYIVQLEPTGSLVLSYNQPLLDTYWLDTPSDYTEGVHDEYFAGNSKEGYWFYILYEHAIWRMRPWGTDGGAPNHVSDTTPPYDWYADSTWDITNQIPNDANCEIQFLNGPTSYGSYPDFMGDYWSHFAVDRWGTHISFSDTDHIPISPGVYDVDSGAQTSVYSTPGGTQYHSWNAYSDYTAHSVSDGSMSNVIASTKYNSLSNSDHITVAYLHSSIASGFTKPGDSPDGTKIAMRSDWLDATGGTADLFIGVAYYPYPPEITSTSANGGTVAVSFNWRTDQPDPRTYTTRGWPDADNDHPCPPRETELFRLWRSSDKTTWIPLGTVNADIFTRYDFSDGTWQSGYSASAVWSIADNPGNGTWYYAVTSKEWSGLESHTLSNIFSITVSGGNDTGAQDTAYPASPGDLDDIGTSDFHTSFSVSDSSIVKAYNIYANDGSPPLVQQQNLIATVPTNHCSGGSCQWVDWLGNTDGTTEYIIAAVDTQGNISSSSYVTNQSSTHCGGANDCSAATPEPTADGQYLVVWDDMYAAYSAGTNHAPVAVNDTAVTSQDTPVTVNVIANDYDANHDVLTIAQHDIQSSNGGTVTQQDDNNLTYTPASGFTGTDTFTYTASDSQEVSNTAPVTITIQTADSGGNGSDSGGGCFINSCLVPTRVKFQSLR